MDGPKRQCGAASGLTTVKNVVSLACLVMDKSTHSYLAFSGARVFTFTNRIHNVQEKQQRR
ncbi:hypothetical protein C1H46_042436 [Malus baccata]|uniref:Uncharacterized protein n=1 Tax=Malus baccata TaxID=106549 RepID=A0A540KCR7_MALBA|nr:hypothetical protein C1H46_042436 [Malus baccata]